MHDTISNSGAAGRAPITIHLVRHGQTDWNAQRRLQGWTDVALNATGLEQARAAALELSARPINAVFSSDLGRARQTAQPIADQAGVELAVDVALRERRYGVIEGLDDDELKREFAGVARNAWEDPDFAFDGGETRRDTYDRVAQFFTALLCDPPPNEIVVVSHGGALRVARGFLEGISVEELPSWHFANGEITTMVIGRP